MESTLLVVVAVVAVLTIFAIVSTLAIAAWRLVKLVIWIITFPLRLLRII